MTRPGDPAKPWTAEFLAFVLPLRHEQVVRECGGGA